MSHTNDWREAFSYLSGAVPTLDDFGVLQKDGDMYTWTHSGITIRCLDQDKLLDAVTVQMRHKDLEDTVLVLDAVNKDLSKQVNDLTKQVKDMTLAMTLMAATPPTDAEPEAEPVV
jgi:hypothetical protein